MPVAMTAKDTCPDACPFKSGGCYAQSGAINIHWSRLSRGQTGITYDDFCQKIARLRKGTIWRWGQCGDFESDSQKGNNSIDSAKLIQLIAANQGKDVISYTHKPVLDHQDSVEAPLNRAIIKSANDNGFTINLSANSLHHADELLALNIGPVVSVVPLNTVGNTKTPKGTRVVLCPATTHENVTCSTCGLCAKNKREYVIGFKAHGSAKYKVDAISKTFV